MERSTNLELALACVHDAHRQLFFQKLGQIEPWYKELFGSVRYCIRSWRNLIKQATKAKSVEVYSETGVEFDREDFTHRVNGLKAFFETVTKNRR